MNAPMLPQNLNIRQLPILRYQKLCGVLGIDPKLREWRSLAGLDENVFDVLVQQAFANYAEAVQLAPASEAHHHCGPGGLLLHTHDVISIALRKRRAYQLPVGGTISDINEKRHLWTYGVFAGCLLHDIGKLLANIQILVSMRNGSTRFWNPHDEPITQLKGAQHYTVEFRKLPYSYHSYVAPTLFDLLPRIARSWIANETPLMHQLCAHLRGDRFESGTLGDIAEYADRLSTARSLQLPMSTLRFSKTIPLIDRYIHYIRDWIREGKIRLNMNGGIGFVSKDGHVYFVCRSLAEKLIKACADDGISDSPRDPVRIYDILQEHGYAVPTPEDRAIWSITVTGKDQEFKHTFTTLKFDARRLTVPTRLMDPFEGEITTGDKPETAKPAIPPEVEAAEAAPQETKTSPTANEPSKTNEEPAEDTEQESAKDPREARIKEDEKQETEKDIEAEKTEDAEAPPRSVVFEAAKQLRQLQSEKKSAEENTEDTASGEEPETHHHENGEAELKPQESEEQNRDENPEEPAEQADQPQDYVPETEEDIEEADFTQAPADITPDTASETVPKTQEAATRSKSSDSDPPRASIALYSGLTESTPDLASKMLAWLQKGLIEKTILTNHPVALVHIVDDGVFLVSPGIFKDFCRVHELDESTHRKVSKGFDRLKNNIKTDDGMNIHTYWAVGTHRAGKIAGRKIPFSLIYGDDYPIPKPNKFLKRNFGSDE